MKRHLGKVLRGSALNVADLVLKVAATMVTTPLMIHSLGVTGFGLWLLVMTVAGYCALLDLGITFSASRFIAMAAGAGDLRREGLVVETAGKHFRHMTWAILLLSPLLVWGAGHWVAAEDVWQVEVALAVALGTMLVRFSMRKSLVVLRGVIRHDLIAFCSIIRTLAQSSALIIVLQEPSSILWVALLQAGGEVLEQIALRMCARRYLKAATSGTPAEAGELRLISREMRVFAAQVSLIMVGEAARLQTGPWIVNFHRGLDAVPVFSIGLRLLTMLQDVVGAVFGGTMLTVFSQMHGAGDDKGLKAGFFRVSEMAAAFSFCAVLGCVWLSPAFFDRWVGPHFSAAAELLLIAALPYALNFSQYPAHNLLYSLDRSLPLAKLSLYGGVASALLGLVLGIWWGIHGVVAGLALEMLVTRLVVVPVLVSRATGVSVSKYLWSAQLWPALKVMTLPLIAVFLLRGWLQPDYTRLAWLAGAYAAVCALSFMLFGIRGDERTILFKKAGFLKEDENH